VLLAFLLLLSAQPQTPCSDVASCRALAVEAQQRSDFEAFHDLAWAAYRKGRNNDPALMLLVARAQSLSGRPGDALVMLERIAATGAPTDVATSEDFARVRALPRWPEVASKFGAAAETAGAGSGTPPVKPESSRREPAKPDPANPVKPEPARPEPLKSELPRPESPKPARPTPEPPKGEPSKPEPAPAAPPKSETSKPEPARPAAEALKPKAGTRKPEVETPKPGTESPKPAAESPKPDPAAPAAPKREPGEPLKFTTVLTPSALVYDAVSRRFIIADRQARRLAVIDENTGQVATLVGAQGALGEIGGVAIDPQQGDLWVVTAADNATVLHRMQLISGRVLSTAKVAAIKDPIVAMAFARGAGLVLADAMGIIWNVHPAGGSNKIGALEYVPRALAADASGRLYISAGAPRIARFTLAPSMRKLDTIDVEPSIPPDVPFVVAGKRLHFIVPVEGSFEIRSVVLK
jgi:hypothetical protein